MPPAATMMSGMRMYALSLRTASRYTIMTKMTIAVITVSITVPSLNKPNPIPVFSEYVRSRKPFITV